MDSVNVLLSALQREDLTEQDAISLVVDIFELMQLVEPVTTIFERFEATGKVARYMMFSPSYDTVEKLLILNSVYEMSKICRRERGRFA